MLRGEVIGALSCVVGLRGYSLLYPSSCHHAGQHQFSVGDKALRALWRLFAYDLWKTEALRVRLATGPWQVYFLDYTIRCLVYEVGLVLWSAGSCTLKMLAQWLQPARLETRTKESNTYASSKVANLGCEMKVKVWDPARVHHRPTRIY